MAVREFESTRAKVRGGLSLVSQPADWEHGGPAPHLRQTWLRAPSPGNTEGEEQWGVTE